MKIAICVFFSALIFTFTVSAQSDSVEFLNGTENFEGALSYDAQSILSELGSDPESTEWISGITVEGVFGHIFEFIRTGGKQPLITGSAVLALILISSALASVSENESEILNFTVVLCIALSVASPIWKCISTAVNAIKDCSTFMLSFVPGFAGITAASGGTSSAAVTSSFLLTAAEITQATAAFVILPAMGSYLAVALCTEVSPLLCGNEISESIRKIIFWFLSLVTTVFLGVLTIQSTVSTASDTLALKTGKFILGTAVPIAGPALSEAAATVAGSLSILRSSVGIYGIVALCAILLPIFSEVTLWRVTLTVCAHISFQFSLPNAGKILKAIDNMLSMLIGIILLTGAMYIISLTTVIGGVKAL